MNIPFHNLALRKFNEARRRFFQSAVYERDESAGFKGHRPIPGVYVLFHDSTVQVVKFKGFCRPSPTYRVLVGLCRKGSDRVYPAAGLKWMLRHHYWDLTRFSRFVGFDKDGRYRLSPFFSTPAQWGDNRKFVWLSSVLTKRVAALFEGWVHIQVQPRAVTFYNAWIAVKVNTLQHESKPEKMKTYTLKGTRRKKPVAIRPEAEDPIIAELWREPAVSG